MAILKDFITNVGGSAIEFKDAYWRVMSISGNKNELLVSVEVMKSRDSDCTIGLFSFSFQPKLDDSNYHTQAYNHLKSLEMFAECVSV